MVGSYIQQKKTSHLQVNTNYNSNTTAIAPTIFTGGSRTASGWVSAYCVSKGASTIQQWACRLDDNNALYKAELFLKELGCIQIQTDTALHLIYSDNPSSRQALKTP